MATRIPRKRRKLAPIANLPKTKRVTPSALPKYVKSLLAAYAPQSLIEAFDQLREGVRCGDMKAIETTLKAYGLLQPAGINVNQFNQNTAAVAPENAPAHRSFESIIRAASKEIDEPARIIDISPATTKDLACLPSSEKSSRQQHAGSATQG